jgi:hypothetical protein
MSKQGYVGSAITSPKVLERNDAIAVVSRGLSRYRLSCHAEKDTWQTRQLLTTCVWAHRPTYIPLLHECSLRIEWILKIRKDFPVGLSIITKYKRVRIDELIRGRGVRGASTIAKWRQYVKNINVRTWSIERLKMLHGPKRPFLEQQESI